MTTTLSQADIDRLLAVADRQEIAQVVYRLARSIDRCDKDLLRTCFHEGATDDHGLFKGKASEFVDWVMEELGKFQRTQHLIGNMIITLDGDKAGVESYFVAHHVVPTPDGKTVDMIAAGRYLDTFEKRGGVWAITHRHAVYDWNSMQPSSSQWEGPPVSEILERGLRGPNDRSYSVIG